MKTGSPNNITYCKSDSLLKIPETMNICYGYYLRDHLKGMIVFSINLSELSRELSGNGVNNHESVIITDYESFFFSNTSMCKSIEECKILADKLPVSDEQNAEFKIYNGSYVFKLKNNSEFPDTFFAACFGKCVSACFPHRSGGKKYKY